MSMMLSRPARPARCLMLQSVQSGETSSIPGACVPHSATDLHFKNGSSPSQGFTCRYGTASGDPASMTDEKPALASAGLMGQVASRLPYPPSFRDEVTKRPGWQPRGLPDLLNFHT
jgi:hypothetical protein